MVKDTVPPDVGEEEDIEEEPKEEKQEEKKIEVKGNISVEITIALERMQTQINALNEVREANNERFSRISGQVGEIRSMVVENEKNMKDIEVKSTMASDLVKEVQPEKLSSEVKKIDIKVEALKAKIEAEKTVKDSIMEELKNIKRQISLFKGTDAILKLNEDTKKELINIQKIKAITEGHANKVEQIFITVQKTFSDFHKLENNTENATTLAFNLQKELNNLKLKLQTMPTKKDFNSLNKTISTNTKFTNKYSEDIKKNKDLITLLKAMEMKLTELVKDSKMQILQLKEEKNKIKKQLNENTKRLGELLGLIELLEKKVAKYT